MRGDRYYQILESLDGEEKDALEQAFNNGRVSSRTLAKVLSEHGFSIHDRTISRARRAAWENRV